jgi:hypothetical protein
MITTPIAINQDMSAKTIPMGPYFWSSEITVLEKMKEKTTSIPTQNSAVATADGNEFLDDIVVGCRRDSDARNTHGT